MMELPVRTATGRTTSQQSQSSYILTPDSDASYFEESDKKQRWEDALKHCERELSKEDYQFIVNLKSPEELVKAIDEMINKTKHSSVPRTLRNLKPHLSQVQTFIVGVLAATALDVVESVCIWGLITLTLQLAERSEEILEAIADMWIEIGNSLQIFDEYKTCILEDKTLSLALFETHEELLKFAVATIKILKLVRGAQFHEYKDQSKHIANCRAKFDKTSSCIAHRIQTIKERVQAQVLTQEKQSSPRTEMLRYLNQNAEVPILPIEEEKPNLSCHHLHLPRNPKFYGREDIIVEICESLSKQRDKGSVPSVALWATAGIGKTHIASEYAYRQRDAGLEVIFWVDVSDETEYMKAFNDMAHLLKLPGAAGSRDFEQNRLVVLSWLQETKTPWLVIFDNVDDPTMLNSNTPTHGCGSILLTCRSELTAASSALTTIEVPAFADAEGSSLLLQHLDLSDPTDEERAASMELSDLLGGHALAINVMARSIAAKKKKLPDFVRSYKEKPRVMHKKPRRKIFNQYYKRDDDIESLWAVPFEMLQPDEATALGILSMCGPNRLPSSTFIRETMDQDEVDDVLLGLRQLSLVNIDETGTLISTHRLIQVEFRNYLSREARIERWYEAVDLVRAAFPRQEKGSTLFNQWKDCELLVEHVIALAERHRELEYDGQLDYLEDFVYLISDAARQAFTLLFKTFSLDWVLAYGIHHCRDKTSIPYSNLCVNMGSMHCERGQDKSGLKYNNLVLEIREGCLDPMDSEIANALSNSALNMVACGQDTEKALEMLRRSLEIDLSKPPEIKKAVIHLRYFNLGFAYRALGRLEEARECVDKASECARAEFGEDSRYLTISYRMYADFAMQAHHYEEAFDHAVRSRDIAKLSGAMTAWVASSLEYLEQARIITLVNEREKSDAGETARVLHKLSQAYAMAGDSEKANASSRQADTIYQQLMATGEYSRSDDEKQKWDYLICIKFR
ncbi:hypothetical protein V8C40DRAFT_263826 [Trichoderma camerunense]